MPSESLGTAGGPKGSETDVAVGVHLVTRQGGTGKGLVTLPKGEAVLAVAASETGLVVTAGPLVDLVPGTSASAHPWQLIVAGLDGRQRTVWSYRPGGTLEAPPAVAAAGGRWAAVTQAARPKAPPTEAVLAEGSLAQSTRARPFTARSEMLPMAVAVAPDGKVALYDFEYAGASLRAPRFGPSAHVALVWTGHGTIVPAPGGFLAVEGTSVERPEAGGRSIPVGSLPKGTSVVSVSGDGQSVVLLLATRKHGLTTWAIGPAPKALDAILAIDPSALFLTSAGVVGVTLDVHGRIVTVRYAAAGGA